MRPTLKRFKQLCYTYDVEWRDVRDFLKVEGKCETLVELNDYINRCILHDMNVIRFAILTVKERSK